MVIKGADQEVLVNLWKVLLGIAEGDEVTGNIPELIFASRPHEDLHIGLLTSTLFLPDLVISISLKPGAKLPFSA